MVKSTKQSTKSVRTRNRMRRYRQRKKIRVNYEHCVEKEKNDFSDRYAFEQIENVNNDHHSTDEHFDLKEKLRIWVINHRITHTAVNDLLKILILAGFTFLPKDSRTLMNTPKYVDIKPMGTGKFWYQGIRVCMLSLFAKLKKNMVLHLDFNFDGMQLFNSSKTEFWPMLCAIQGRNTVIGFRLVNLYL